MIYAVAYTKGGVGKTTIAVNLAAYFATKGKTLLIDGDPQATTSIWSGWRRDNEGVPMPTTVQLLGKAIFDEGRELAKAYDYVVVDVAGRDGVGLRNALLLADRVITPMGNSGFDVIDAQRFKETFEQAKAFNRDVEYRVVLNAMKGSTTDAEDFIERMQMPTFKTMLGHRRAYVQATNNGLATLEFKPVNAAATFEIRKLIEEIESWA